jgi:hypothetical protein
MLISAATTPSSGLKKDAHVAIVRAVSNIPYSKVLARVEEVEFEK